MRYEICRIFTLPHNAPRCRSEERSDVGTPGIRYELRDMRYEIWRIFTLPSNDPHCRSEERSDVGTPGLDTSYEI